MTTTAPIPTSTDVSSRYRLAVAGAVVQGAWSLAFTYVSLAFRLTPDDQPFRNTADYWYTGLGIPLAVSQLMLAVALHRLNAGRDGKRGRAAVWLICVPLVVLIVMFSQALIQGQTSSWGPTYLLAAALTDVGILMLAAGSWGTSVVPRWLLAMWAFAWVVGTLLAQGPTPLVLTVAAAFLVVHFSRTMRAS
jgi:hypothetical protein